MGGPASEQREYGEIHACATLDVCRIAESKPQQQRHPQTSGSSIDSATPRPSIDPEERPFEHWYRGEVSRNGSVGELRIGRHMEMLEIANYGQTPTRPTDHWWYGGAGVRRRHVGSTAWELLHGC
jgi:hypothetical protein